MSSSNIQSEVAYPVAGRPITSHAELEVALIPFKYGDALKEIERNGAKILQCYVCGTEFLGQNRRQGAKDHMKTHFQPKTSTSPENPYCLDCRAYLSLIPRISAPVEGGALQSQLRAHNNHWRNMDPTNTPGPTSHRVNFCQEFRKLAREANILPSFPAQSLVTVLQSLQPNDGSRFTTEYALNVALTPWQRHLFPWPGLELLCPLDGEILELNHAKRHMEQHTKKAYHLKEKKYCAACRAYLVDGKEIQGHKELYPAHHVALQQIFKDNFDRRAKSSSSSLSSAQSIPNPFESIAKRVYGPKNRRLANLNFHIKDVSSRIWK